MTISRLITVLLDFYFIYVFTYLVLRSCTANLSAPKPRILRLLTVLVRSNLGMIS